MGHYLHWPEDFKVAHLTYARLVHNSREDVHGNHLYRRRRLLREEGDL